MAFIVWTLHSPNPKLGTSSENGWCWVSLLLVSIFVKPKAVKP